MRPANLLLAAGIGLVSCLGLAFGAKTVLPTSPVVQGLYIGDRRVPDEGSAVEWLGVRGEALRSRSVRFVHDDLLIEATLGEVGVELDVSATLEDAAKVGHEGSWLHRMRQALRARRGELDVPLVWRIDSAKAKVFFARIAPALAVAAQDARLDLAARQKIPDVTGRELDVDASILALSKGSHEDGEGIFLITRRVPAKVSIFDLADVDISKVVSSYETTFSLYGTGAGRAHNIRHAASKIDGVVIMPGSIFSFNDRVGPRTKENGFTIAPEIQGDELTPGIGGGTCQVSSTLHAAAVFGALDIMDRKWHSRVSSYTPLGLDATVHFPSVDLKIKNTLPFPVMVHAYLSKPTAIRVELLGGDPIAKVEYGYGVANSEDFVRRVTVKSHFPPGKRHLHQKGTRGFDVTSILRIHFNDGREETRHYYSGYKPTPEVYWVAPGYETSELPPLPEHAKGVEGRVSGDDVYSM